jgi:DNA modification methylase
MTKQSAAIGKRSINIYSEDGQSAELCVPNYVAFNSKAGNRLHPTEKPVQLLRYLIELFSRPGELVLDPFSGSASTGEAALLTHRRALLVERDDEFFQKGVSRLNNLLDEMENTLL